MCMCDENIMNLFRLKIKDSPVNLVSVFTLIHTRFNKNLKLVALNIKTRTCNCFYPTKKFKFHILTPPHVIVYSAVISGVNIHSNDHTLASSFLRQTIPPILNPTTFLSAFPQSNKDASLARCGRCPTRMTSSGMSLRCSAHISGLSRGASPSTSDTPFIGFIFSDKTSAVCFALNLLLWNIL